MRILNEAEKEYKEYSLHIDTVCKVNTEAERVSTYADLLKVDDGAEYYTVKKFANFLIKIVENETERICDIFDLNTFIFELDEIEKADGNFDEIVFLIRSDKPFNIPSMEKLLRSLFTDVIETYDGTVDTDRYEDVEYTVEIKVFNPQYMYIEKGLFSSEDEETD